MRRVLLSIEYRASKVFIDDRRYSTEVCGPISLYGRPPCSSTLTYLTLTVILFGGNSFSSSSSSLASKPQPKLPEFSAYLRPSHASGLWITYCPYFYPIRDSSHKGTLTQTKKEKPVAAAATEIPMPISSPQFTIKTFVAR